MFCSSSSSSSSCCCCCCCSCYLFYLLEKHYVLINRIQFRFQQSDFTMIIIMSLQAHLHVLRMLQFLPLTLTTCACPLLFILSLCLFLSYGPFNCISFHKFLRQHSVFSLCSSGLISVLLVLSTIYLFMKVSFSPDIIPSGWLDSKQ